MTVARPETLGAAAHRRKGFTRGNPVEGSPLAQLGAPRRWHHDKTNSDRAEGIASGGARQPRGGPSANIMVRRIVARWGDIVASRRLVSSARRPRRCGGLIWVLAIAVALIAGSTPASATIVERYRSSESYDDVRWDCGYAMRVVGVETHKVQVRADKKVDGIVYITDNYDFREVWTAADGRSYADRRGPGLAKDVKAKSVGGSVYEFTFKDSGRPSTIIDSSGAVVYRDRGNLSFKYTIDIANGTFNFLGVKVSGPHPGVA